ncbi:speckle-type POZ protein-like [Daphnia pulex]|uniref:speckle-type POZ protein-like n=1 Tax=Daphnia pulex TaxID=6669 RepID=UPI001EDE221A|nr:speckle-type POZ protein-like [Daphnia pulex]
MSASQESNNEAVGAATSQTDQQAENTLPVGFFRPIASNWCHSMSQLVKVDFEWTIHHVLRYELNRQGVVISEPFSAKEIPYCQWMLQAHFASNQQSGVVVKLSSATPAGASLFRIPIPIRVKFAIVNKMREKVSQKELNLPRGTELPCTLNTFNLGDVSNNRQEDLLIDNAHLAIYCEIETWVSKAALTGRTENFRDQPLFNDDELIQHLGGLHQTMKFSDVTFTIRGCKFEAHKAILSARSPVFAAMFDHETAENLSHQVKINDVDPEVFQELLRFVYTGRIPVITMKTLTTGLLAAAGKYLLGSLMTACEKYLVNDLSADNCIELLILADGHCADYLKWNALNFLRSFPNEVMATDGWSTAKRDHSTWLCDIQQAAFTSTRP